MVRRDDKEQPGRRDFGGIEKGKSGSAGGQSGIICVGDMIACWQWICSIVPAYTNSTI